MSTDSTLPADNLFLLSELYHENSKQREHDYTFYSRIQQVNANPVIHHTLSRTWKHYPGAPRIALPAPDTDLNVPLVWSILNRRSRRTFADTALTLGQLSTLLACSVGRTGELRSDDGSVQQSVRAAPSGGGLYPIETWVMVRNVAVLEPGVYHYLGLNHSLELLTAGYPLDQLTRATSEVILSGSAAVTFAFTAVFEKSRFKYQERSYRFILLEAGHIVQNLLLVATALGLHANPVGGFIDDYVNDMLGVDGVHEAALYLTAIGSADNQEQTCSR